MKSPPTIALATTLCDAEQTLVSFVRYHLHIGIDHLFLFFDNPNDASFERVDDDPRVSCIFRDDALRRRWERVRRKTPEKVHSFLDREAMARQQFNCAVAIEEALQRKIDWIIHIDSDELFYSPHESVKDHFAALDEQGVDHCWYTNHEAIPERFDVGDIFRDVTLFKTNSSTHARPLRPPSFAAIPPTWFHFYSNGKAAARVTDRLGVNGVHRFRVPPDAVSIGGGRTPAILHYPCCGFQHFRRKYETLGAFGDRWYDQFDIRSAIGSTHLDARDVVHTGQFEQMARFYASRFVMDNPADAESLIEGGWCTRIREPALWLNGAP